MIGFISRNSQGTGRLLLRRSKTTKSDVDPLILKKLDEKFLKFVKSDSKSLLKKHLTLDIFKGLRTKQTKMSTLMDCIQSGLINHDSNCGIYAPDADAYKVFADIFDPIIEEYHFGFKKTDQQPPRDFGNPCIFGDLDPFKNYIASTRIRCARSLAGYPFNPCMTKQQYDEIEDIVNCTLSSLQGELKGKYYPLFGMKKSVHQKLVRDHFLFKAGDRFLQAANASRFWPTGRGIYHNFDKTFVVWCNEEDHIRIISMQRGGNFGEVFSRLVRGVSAIEEKIAFARDCRLGYLTFCPTNLGTTIRASVHIRLPRLSSNRKALDEITDKYKLQVRGTRGEHSEVEGGIYDISNKRRLGLTEFEAVRELYCGITEIIEFESAEEAFPSADPFKEFDSISAKKQEATPDESKKSKPNAIKAGTNSESKLNLSEQKVGKKVPKK